MEFLTPMHELGEYLKDSFRGDPVTGLPTRLQMGRTQPDPRQLRRCCADTPWVRSCCLRPATHRCDSSPAPSRVSTSPRHRREVPAVGRATASDISTQALSGNGVVATKDSRGRLLDRRYFVHMETGLSDPNRVDEAVISVPADGVVRSNFGKDVELTSATRTSNTSMATSAEPALWRLHELDSGLQNPALGKHFHDKFIKQSATYNIPAIDLDEDTDQVGRGHRLREGEHRWPAAQRVRAAHRTFAGDDDYYDKTGTTSGSTTTGGRTQAKWSLLPGAGGRSRTPTFLQAVTMLTTRNAHLARHRSDRPPAISAKREDVLKLTLERLPRSGANRCARRSSGASDFLADRHIFARRDVPYPKQLVPLAAIKVVHGQEADLHRSSRERLVRWYWCGMLGELYGSAIEITVRP